MRKKAVAWAGIWLLLGSISWAQTAVDPAIYKPTLGQMGKDVMWLPTPNELVDNMLRMAQVNDQDLLYDLGAGDGVIAITAAKKHGARAVGIEYNPKLAAFAQQKVIEAGVQDKVRIIQGDIFQTDFSQATVLTLYLLPEINYQLRPIILKMKPGTRVVSHDFDMVEWEPDAVTQTAGLKPSYKITFSDKKTPSILQTRSPQDIDKSDPAMYRALQAFGQCDRYAIEADRKPTMVQAAILLNDKLIRERLVIQKDSRLESLLRSDPPLPNEKVVEELYLAALSRFPSKAEAAQGVDMIQKHRDQGAEDLLWTLVNRLDFLFY